MKKALLVSTLKGNKLMAYKELDTKSVIEYLKTRPALADVLPTDDEYEASEIGDGNLNMVFIIQSKTKPERSVIVKQALPYLRVVGESWPLTRDRIIYETEALKIYNEISPEFSPIVYDNDYEMSVAVMENLNKHEIMRKPLVSRERFPKFAEHISSFLANVLFKTSDLYLSSKDKKALQEKFMNPELRKLQEDFVYTNPFMEAEENEWNPLIDDLAKEIRSDGQLKIAINKLKMDYVLKAQSLIHADLHTGSIMLNKEETKVIDPEFAFVGPMAYDIAAVIQNLVLNYASHFAHSKNKEERESYQKYLVTTINDIWNGFASKFDKLWQNENNGDLSPNSYWDFEGGKEAFARYRQIYIQDVLRDVAGIGGVKMLRRMFGIVSVWDITSIKDDKQRAKIERYIVALGKRWILEKDEISSIEQLTAMLKEEADKLEL